MNSVQEKSNWIDGSLYPDEEPPRVLDTVNQRMDFIARLCSAWDFGMLPIPETLQQILQPEWKEAVDETRLLTSFAYHLLRDLHHLEPLPYIGQGVPVVLNDVWLAKV